MLARGFSLLLFVLLPFLCQPAGGVSLEDLVTTEAIMGHLGEFQKIAERPQNLGSRAVHLGYNDTVDYILSVLRPLPHLSVSVQHLPVTISIFPSPPSLCFVKPVSSCFEVNTDFLGYLSSSAGEVLGKVQPVQGGCDPSDFSSFEKGNIAMLNRGSFNIPGENQTTCAYRFKVDQAILAGASGVLVFDPEDLLPTLGGTNNAPVPVFGISSALGNLVYEFNFQGREVWVEMKSEARMETFYTMNVLAETKAGDNQNTIVVGSHLDSVPAGAGINDNGSGSATILEAAIQFQHLPPPVNSVRFAWWAAEEWGLLGSKYYTENLSREEKERIKLNLNFDMVGSPNYIRGIYNGREASPEIREGCSSIQELFEKYFQDKGLLFEPTPFNGRSDYGPFLDLMIPAGGLFSGAEEKKTVEQRNRYGGSANVALDSCYHLSCDSVSNINSDSINELGGAAVSVTELLAFLPDLQAFLKGR